MPDNEDLKVPKTSKGEDRFVLTNNFKQDKGPIFWGPNQPFIDEDTYTEPTGWPGFRFLEIPRVVRVVGGQDDEYDGNDLKTDPDDDPYPCAGGPASFIYIGYVDGYAAGIMNLSTAPGEPCDIDTGPGSLMIFDYYKAAVIIQDLAVEYNNDQSTEEIFAAVGIDRPRAIFAGIGGPLSSFNGTYKTIMFTREDCKARYGTSGEFLGYDPITYPIKQYGYFYPEETPVEEPSIELQDGTAPPWPPPGSVYYRYKLRYRLYKSCSDLNSPHSPIYIHGDVGGPGEDFDDIPLTDPPFPVEPYEEP